LLLWWLLLWPLVSACSPAVDDKGTEKAADLKAPPVKKGRKASSKKKKSEEEIKEGEVSKEKECEHALMSAWVATGGGNLRLNCKRGRWLIRTHLHCHFDSLFSFPSSAAHSAGRQKGQKGSRREEDRGDGDGINKEEAAAGSSLFLSRHPSLPFLPFPCHPQPHLSPLPFQLYFSFPATTWLASRALQSSGAPAVRLRSSPTFSRAPPPHLFPFSPVFILYFPFHPSLCESLAAPRAPFHILIAVVGMLPPVPSSESSKRAAS